MKRLKDIIDRNSTGKRVLLLFILTNLIYAFMLVITIPKTMAFAGGMKLLDMMPMGYDSEYIQTLFKALGENGRAVYLHYQIPMDMIYPFLFGISYCLLTAYFLKKLKTFSSPYSHLCYLPVIGGIADYLENFGIITMLITYPELPQITMTASNAFTMTKSIATTLFFVALIIIFFVFIVKMVKERKSSANSLL